MDKNDEVYSTGDKEGQQVDNNKEEKEKSDHEEVTLVPNPKPPPQPSQWQNHHEDDEDVTGPNGNTVVNTVSPALIEDAIKKLLTPFVDTNVTKNQQQSKAMVVWSRVRRMSSVVVVMPVNIIPGMKCIMP